MPEIKKKQKEKKKKKGVRALWLYFNTWDKRERLLRRCDHNRTHCKTGLYTAPVSHTHLLPWYFSVCSFSPPRAHLAGLRVNSHPHDWPIQNPRMTSYTTTWTKVLWKKLKDTHIYMLQVVHSLPLPSLHST